MIGLFKVPPAGVPYISKYDPALDPEATDWAGFVRSFDAKYQRVKDGHQPTRFYLKRLTLKQWEMVRGLPPHQQDRAAVAYGVANIESFAKANGENLVPTYVGEGHDRRLDHDTLEAIGAPLLFDELGQMLVILSNLDPLVSAR